MNRTAAIACVIASAASLAAGLLLRPAASSAYRAWAGTPPMHAAAPPPSRGRELHRHFALLREIERGPKARGAAILGDSITECWRLVPDLQTAAFGPGCLNLGVGSDCAGDLLWRVRNGELDGYEAADIIVCVGTNDLASGRTPEYTAGVVADIVAESRRRQPGARVVLLAVPPRGRTAADPLRLAVGRLNALLAVTPGVIWADCNGTLLGADGLLGTSVMPDHLHPSPEGYARWASAIAARLRQ